MPSLKIYLNDYEKEQVEKLKKYLKLISQRTNTNITLSNLISSFLLTLVAKIEENGFEEFSSVSELSKIGAGVLSINFGSIDVAVDSTPTVSKAVKSKYDIRHYLLEANLSAWRRKINRLKSRLMITNDTRGFKEIRKEIILLENEVTKALQKIKEVPDENLAEAVYNILKGIEEVKTEYDRRQINIKIELAKKKIESIKNSRFRILKGDIRELQQILNEIKAEYPDLLELPDLNSTISELEADLQYILEQYNQEQYYS